MARLIKNSTNRFNFFDRDKLAHSAGFSCVFTAKLAVIFLALFCFLVFAISFVDVGRAEAMEVVKCTARANSDSGNDVLGDSETRVTLELQAADQEPVEGIAITFPSGTKFSTDDAKVTMLSGQDKMTRTNIKASFSADDQNLVATFICVFEKVHMHLETFAFFLKNVFLIK